MDGRQFDRITRAFAREQSRRSALKRAIALIGGGSAAAGLESAEAARLSRPVEGVPLERNLLCR